MRHDDLLGEPVFEGQAREIRAVVLWLCGCAESSSRFPGSQPVSLARDNMHELASREYHVTWKADGTRYMLLCMRDGAYLVDRKFATRRVSVRFPAPLKTHGVATHNATLLDGEMVVDDLPDGTQRRRFLVYDCVASLGESLATKPFLERFSKIARDVVDPRGAFLAEAGKSGAYDFSREPFSVRRKDFAPLAGTAKFVNEFIPRLTHECDGLIFQPSRAAYENGTMQTLLKWKFTHLNSVDFLLKAERAAGGTLTPRLFVGGERETLVEVHEPSGAFALRGSHEDADGLPAGMHPRDVAADGSTARDLNGKIVECAWDKSARFALDDDEAFREKEDATGARGAWRYMRVRSDKDAPNFVTVYKHTLRSILDDITEDEIVAFVEETLKRRVAETADAGMGYAPPT
jgi:mRNA-capping enzyme